MAIIIINPNSTASMTEAMLAQARKAAPHLTFQGWTSLDAPPAIKGPEDGDAATPPLLELVRKASKDGADGIIIGCFDDTALEEAARIAPCPVIGLGQAAYHHAALRHWRFSVVTTLAVSVPILEANIARQGLGAFASRVRASEVPVLALEEDPDGVGAIITAEAHDGIAAVILGCAGMVQVTSMVEDALSIRTIDPVICSARCMSWLV